MLDGMELYRHADKLFKDVDHFDDVIAGELTEDKLLLALTTVKRVRRTSNILVRQLAALRDQTLQP